MNWPAVTPVNCPSTQGCASSSRRPTLKASRCARRRTASSSANRIELRRNPFPSSTHTASGAVTRTSVVPSACRSGSRIPDAGELRLQHPQIAQHFGVAEHSARFGTDRGGDDVGKQRRGLSRQPLPDPVDQRHAHAASAVDAAPTPSAPAERRWQAATDVASAHRHFRVFRRDRVAAASPPRAADPTMRATSTDRKPPGDGPRTTRPTLGLIAPNAEATAVVAAHARTSAVVTSTTKSAASAANSTDRDSRRGRSQTTVAPPRRPASITAANGPGSMSLPARRTTTRSARRAAATPDATR